MARRGTRQSSEVPARRRKSGDFRYQVKPLTRSLHADDAVTALDGSNVRLGGEGVCGHAGIFVHEQTVAFEPQPRFVAGKVFDQLQDGALVDVARHAHRLETAEAGLEP